MKSLITSFRRSLSSRLLLLFLVTTILLVALLVATLAHGFRSQWKTTIRPHLEQYLSFVNDEIGYPPSELRAKELAATLPINIYIQGPHKNYSSSGIPLDLSSLEFHHRRGGRRGNRELHHRRDRQKTAKHNIAIGEHDDRTVLRNQLGEYKLYYEFPHARSRGQHHLAITKTLLILFLILAACYWILRRMLRPVQDIQHAVTLMGSGALETRVPVRSDNDLGSLASSINTMASDIQQMLDAKRQLLLGASHELRSPITRAKIATQMLPPSTNRDRIADELVEMESLITELLESERMKSGHDVLNREPIHLETLLDNVQDELHHPVIEITIAPDLPIVSVDKTRIRLLLRNLINNALTHGANPDTTPTLSITANATHIELVITDNGPGISPEDINNITAPFYRADASRTRSTGGFGLGLHLCELIAKAHGGTLTINSEPGTGTAVTLKLPLRPVPAKPIL